MGMSTSVVGFRPPDEKWQKMKAIWDACTAADTEPPEAVYDFFEGETPDAAGVQVDLKGKAAKEWSNEWAQGYEINIKDLPKDVTIIRFYNSW